MNKQMSISTGQLPEHVRAFLRDSETTHAAMERLREEGVIVEARSAEIIDVGDGCLLLIWADTGHWAIVCGDKSA